jgi:hypothetical protein
MPTSPKRSSWRDVPPIHPAAEMFQLMNEAELDALGQDIKRKGLTSRVVVWSKGPSGGKRLGDPPENPHFELLDGRNRLDAAEMAGLSVTVKDGVVSVVDEDTRSFPPISVSSEQLFEYNPVTPFRPASAS